MWDIIIGLIILAVLVGIGGLLLQFGCGAIIGLFSLIVAGISWIVDKIKGK
jgi:hypothetical protein